MDDIHTLGSVECAQYRAEYRKDAIPALRIILMIHDKNHIFQTFQFIFCCHHVTSCYHLPIHKYPSKFQLQLFHFECQPKIINSPSEFLKCPELAVVMSQHITVGRCNIRTLCYNCQETLSDLITMENVHLFVLAS